MVCVLHGEFLYGQENKESGAPSHESLRIKEREKLCFRKNTTAERSKFGSNGDGG